MRLDKLGAFALLYVALVGLGALLLPTFLALIYFVLLTIVAGFMSLFVLGD